MNKNCLSYWYPKIEGEVPTPETFFVSLSDMWGLASVLDGNPCFYLRALADLLRAAGDEFGWPVFLRTGQGSGKHDWSRTCFVSDPCDVERHIVSLVEWSHLVDFVGLPHNVWVVRKMLPTRPVFKCTRYGGMPVVREWRYFVDGDRVGYGIPYWPEGALDQGGPDREDWREFLCALHAQPPSDVTQIAAAAGRAMGGDIWSVDVLESDNGWFVTDMALAEASYGWGSRQVGGS